MHRQSVPLELGLNIILGGYPLRAAGAVHAADLHLERGDAGQKFWDWERAAGAIGHRAGVALLGGRIDGFLPFLGCLGGCVGQVSSDRLRQGIGIAAQSVLCRKLWQLRGRAPGPISAEAPPEPPIRARGSRCMSALPIFRGFARLETYGRVRWRQFFGKWTRVGVGERAATRRKIGKNRVGVRGSTIVGGPMGFATMRAGSAHVN